MLKPIIAVTPVNQVYSELSPEEKSSLTLCLQKAAGYIGAHPSCCPFLDVPYGIKDFFIKSLRTPSWVEDEEVREFIERYLSSFVVLSDFPCYPSTCHTNDVVAILVRVKKFVEDICFKLYNTEHAYNEDWKSFDRFIREVAMSWGGNLKERSPHLDDESYGAALVRSEERLIDFGNFSKHIEKMSRVVGHYTRHDKVVFVLPIDPFVRDRIYFMSRYGFSGLLFI